MKSDGADGAFGTFEAIFPLQVVRHHPKKGMAQAGADGAIFII